MFKKKKRRKTKKYRELPEPTLGSGSKKEKQVIKLSNGFGVFMDESVTVDDLSLDQSNALLQAIDTCGPNIIEYTQCCADALSPLVTSQSGLVAVYALTAVQMSWNSWGGWTI